MTDSTEAERLIDRLSTDERAALMSSITDLVRLVGALGHRHLVDVGPSGVAPRERAVPRERARLLDQVRREQFASAVVAAAIAHRQDGPARDALWSGATPEELGGAVPDAVPEEWHHIHQCREWLEGRAGDLAVLLGDLRAHRDEFAPAPGANSDQLAVLLRSLERIHDAEQAVAARQRHGATGRIDETRWRLLGRLAGEWLPTLPDVAAATTPAARRVLERAAALAAEYGALARTVV